MTLRVPLGELAAKHDDERTASRAIPDRPRDERDATPPPRKEPNR